MLYLFVYNLPTIIVSKDIPTYVYYTRMLIFFIIFGLFVFFSLVTV